MLKLLAFTLLCFLLTFALAEDFSGQWQIHAVKSSATFPPDLEEIKYPVWLKLEKNGSELQGWYKDQAGHQSKLVLAKVVNAGLDLVLVGDGATKSKEAWMPIHQAKIEAGHLKGITYYAGRKCFDWIGVKVEDNLIKK